MTKTGSVSYAAGLVVCLLLLSSGSSSVYAQRRDNPQRDSQFWPDTQLAINIRPQWKLILFGTVRLGRNDTAFVNEQVGVGVNRALGKHFSSGLFYRYINAEPTPGRQSREHRIGYEVTARRELGLGWLVQDRNRIEWRDINTRVSWRYRNRLQFERPLAISEHKLTPYVACEPMYDTRHRTWSRTQCYVGSRIPLNKHVTFDGFYMRQWDARANPGFLHVFGAYWRLEY